MFSISKWDYIWFPVLSVYAYFFKSTPFNKAVLCFIATALAVTGSILNYDKLFTEPQKEGIMTVAVQSYFSNYLLTDFISFCARGYLMKESIRKDMIFHHILFYLLNKTTTALAANVLIIAEILSIWPLFTNNTKTLTYFRIFSIFPIRFLIWGYGYYIRKFAIKSHFLFLVTTYVPYITVALDSYWLYKNIKILYKINQEEKQQTLIKND
jgi:hypothetical protein